jgi:hypothetical protein
MDSLCPFVVGNVTIIELKMLLEARILSHYNYFVMVSFSVQITWPINKLKYALTSSFAEELP